MQIRQNKTKSVWIKSNANLAYFNCNDLGLNKGFDSVSFKTNKCLALILSFLAEGVCHTVAHCVLCTVQTKINGERKLKRVKKFH